MTENQQINNKTLNEEIRETQVVVMAGGRARRLGLDVPKCLLDIEGGEKLIDKCISSLRNDGFSKFVFLLGHRHEEVTQYVGNGAKHGIDATFSIDPPSKLGWGKGKAFKYALLQNKIDSTKRCIVVFPDDLLLEENMYRKMLDQHLESSRTLGSVASMILVPGTEYPYGVAEIASSGLITRFSEKPVVSMPTSVGVYVFEPDVYSLIQQKIDLQDPRPVDLESTILPSLVADLKLSSMVIPTEKWLPINTLKEYEHAVQVLSVLNKNRFQGSSFEPRDVRGERGN